MNETAEHWYAVKIYSEKTRIMKYLAKRDIELFIPDVDGKAILGPIAFVHCTEEALIQAKMDWFQQLMLFKDPDREKPQMIETSELESFRMVLNIQNQEIYPLEIHDRSFLAGQKVRVIKGPLKGAIGVIKRIKGDRRLVISLSGVAAIATSFVHPESLEKI